MNVYHSLTDSEKAIVLAIYGKGNKSWEEVADELGISVRTLFRYRQKPHIKTAIREVALEELEAEVPTITKALMKNVKKGDFRSIELAIKMLGMLQEKQVIETTIKDERMKYSETELRQEIEEIERQLKVISGGVK